MGEKGIQKPDYIKITLDFLKDKDPVMGFDILIDVYDEIRYSKMNKKNAHDTFMRVLNNLKSSDILETLLGSKDQEVLKIFLEDFLQITCDENDCYIGNPQFADMELEEFYRMLIEIKYLKIQELNNKGQLSING